MMIIYADIRHLIVILLFTNFGWSYPLPLKRILQVPGKRMIMTKKSCQDPIGNKGICMFKYDCIRQNGVTLSTCVDGFLFGACCFLKEDSIQVISDDMHSQPTHLVDDGGQNETIYNFYQIEPDASLNSSTKYSDPVQEIFNTSFNIFSNENSKEKLSTNLPHLFHSMENKQSTTTDLSDNEKNFVTFKNVLNQPIYNATDDIPSTISDENFSQSSVFEYTTFPTPPIDYDEESEINNNSSLLYLLLQNGMKINNTNDISTSPSPIEAHTVPVYESSKKIQFVEYKNQLTSTNHFEDSSKEKTTVDITNYSNESKGSENSTSLNRDISSELNLTESSVSNHDPFTNHFENSSKEKTTVDITNYSNESKGSENTTTLNRDISSDLNLTESSVSNHDPFTNHFENSSKEKSTVDITYYFNEGKEIENSTILNIYIFSDLNSTESSESTHDLFTENVSVSTEKTNELNDYHLLVDYNNISIPPSELSDSSGVPSLEIDLLSFSENNPTKFHNKTKASGYENSIASDKNFLTESTQNTIVLSTFETTSIPANSERTNLELTSVVSSVSQDHLKLNELEKKEFVHANLSSSNLDDGKNLTFYDKPSKLSNDSATSFNSKSDSSSMTLDDRKSTKSVLPTLSWSSNSILPESFQSVISQLIEQEISSPSNFILDYETHATPAVDENTLVDQNVFLDSEESVKLEFKSHSISGFLDDEYEKNIFLSEQNSNTEPEADNFTSISITDSSVGLNAYKFDDRNKNIFLIPNVLINDLTKNELNIKLTENVNTDISSKDESEKMTDEYYTKEIKETLENFMNASESKETNIDTSTSSTFDLLTEESYPHTKLLESNLNSYSTEVSLSTQTEPYTFPITAFQDDQKEFNMNLSTFQLLDQNFSEPSTSFTQVQSQSLYNTTEFSTLTEEATTNSYPTVIQIINNHTGKNSSKNKFSNHLKDTSESHVDVVLAQSEKTEMEEGSTTIYPIVNISLGNSSSLYDTETVVNTYTSVILNVEDIEENHQVDSLIYPVVNSDTSNSFNESLDSSQSASFEIIPPYTDINSTNTFQSSLIDSSTSPFTTIVHGVTKDTELNSTNFEERYLSHTDGQFMESNDDSYNFIFTEEEQSTTSGNYSDGNLDPITTEQYYTKSTHNIISLNYSDGSSSNVSFGSHITTELTNVETPIFTTNNAQISETVSLSVLPTLSDLSYSLDMESPTLPFSSKPTDTIASDTSTTSSTETIPSSTSTYTAITQNLDFLTHGDLFSNTSDEHSAVHSTGYTKLSTMSTSEYPSIQDGAAYVDKLTNLSTQTYSTPVPATITVPKVDIHRWNYKKDCGVRLMQPVGRIVGGKNTYFGKWPWQALVKEATWLGLFVKNKCGGVLITSKYVLTAAHCQPGFLASLLVVLGTHDLAETFDNKASIIRNVKRMVVHRHYNAQTFENDLALLEMEAPVEFLPYVVPICLPHRNEDFTGKMAFVTGWGKLTAGGDVPNILQEVQVPIVSNGECQSMFYQAGHHKAIRSNFVCAGFTNGGQDSCEGDSGGPLMVQRDDTRWVLVGTVSHGIGCADPNLPGVYMRMSSYRPWIDSIIYK